MPDSCPTCGTFYGTDIALRPGRADAPPTPCPDCGCLISVVGPHHEGSTTSGSDVPPTKEMR